MFNLSNLEKKDIFIDIPESEFKAIIFYVIRNSRLAQKENIFRGIIDREQLGSTSIGNNTAIPHCRLKDFDYFYVKFILFKKRLGYYAPNGEEIRYVFLVFGSNADNAYYINTLAHIAKVMKNPNLRKNLLQTNNEKEVCRLFRKYAQTELEEMHVWK
ncbi:MAG: PTS sugar transporter subunit IIA [Candidatus Omnitrophica bacterium]|nr:PTS sugar transporter subunit IIA [Candidatus Omnitrophota bacterium]